jgi:hypothetical protein
MDEMNKLFEERGFTVERKWESEHNWYRFTISKDGKYQVGTYTYPCGANGHAASQHQRMFVEKMIKDFERSFDYKILMNSIYGKPAVDPRYRNDALCAYVESVGGFGNCLKKYEEEMWPKMNPYLETLRLPSGRTKIKNVIFNDPATIVFWTDGTKTVVKAQDGDVFDPEKGLAMAISKKAFGNKGNYCNELKRWLPKTYICMYCGADSYNPDWDHACDDCKDKPFEPIPESLKKDICSKIKLPDLSGLQIASMALDNVAKSLKDRRKKSAVQKAYDVLVKSRDGNLDCSTLLHPIEEAIGYLGEALEVGDYNIDRINRGLGIDWDLYFNDIEPFERTVFRLWDWGYKRILPKDKFEIIKPYLKKGR